LARSSSTTRRSTACPTFWNRTTSSCAPHQDVYEKIGQLIRAGKTASPITLKTFYPARRKNRRHVRAIQFLLRLAGDAASIINAEDYGRAIYDLAIRRNLIRIGEDMVNIAFDAPIDMPPEQQIDDAERRLFELAETGRSKAGFVSFGDALTETIEMAHAAYQSRRRFVRDLHRLA
jgi:replicative DNA helicase